MADNDKPRYPSVFVTSSGAPEGCVNVHDQATGATVVAEATEAGYTQAIRDLNSQRDK